MPADSASSTRPLVTRRRLLGALLATAAASLVDVCYAEPRWLDVSKHKVEFKGNPLGGAVRILHLSDLHASWAVPISMIDHAITLGLAQKPDIICLTGDFVTDGQRFDRAAYVQALRRLSAAAPAYAVLGNHDKRNARWAARHHELPGHLAVESILAESGIELLHNRSKQIQAGEARFVLAGVGDLWSGEVDGASAFADIDPEQPVVLLAHNPDTKDRLDEYSWDLMLCGHTHGGQVRIPLEGAAFAPVKDKRYIAGLKPWRGRQIYVSRGVGNLEGVRFRCRPEVGILDLA